MKTLSNLKEYLAKTTVFKGCDNNKGISLRLGYNHWSYLPPMPGGPAAPDRCSSKGTASECL